MQFKLRGKQTGNIVLDTLRNNKVEDVELLKNPTDEDTVHWGDYYNMTNVTKVIVDGVNDSEDFVIVVDEDLDGITSSYILYKYLKHFGVNIQYLFHEKNKSHGLTEDIMRKINPNNIVLIPDAGSNDYKYLETLCYTNQIIIIDHHEIEDEERLYNIPQVLCVNNQSSKNVNSNKNLTGVGMVYRLLQSLDSYTGMNYADEHLFEVAVGQISDVCNLVDNEIRYLVMNGLKQPKSHLFCKLLEDKLQNKGDKIQVLPSDIGYGLAPKYNALLRVGTLEERTRAFEILCDENVHKQIVKKPSKSRKTGKITFKQVEEGDYANLLKLLNKKKKQQKEIVDNIKNKMGTPLGEGISIGIQNSGVGGLSGLIAGELARDTKKPSLLITPNVDGLYNGSGRGRQDIVRDFKAWINGVDNTIEVLGHNNAFGVRNLSQEQLNKLIEASKDLKAPSTYIVEVDAIVTPLTSNHLNQIDSNKELFGNGNEAPLIGTEFHIDANKVKYYEKSGFASIQMNGYQIVIYNLDEKVDIDLFLEAVENHKTIKVEATGKANRTFFAGRETLQFQVVDLEFNYLDYFF